MGHNTSLIKFENDYLILIFRVQKGGNDFKLVKMIYLSKQSEVCYGRYLIKSKKGEIKGRVFQTISKRYLI